MKKIFIYIILVVIVCNAFAQTTGDEDKEMFNKAKQRDQQAIDEAKNSWWTASMKTHEERIAWWRDAKFGMFIHWGVYSLPGGEWKGKKVSGYAEHLMRKEKISRSEYLELAHQFNPVKFNAEEWILNAKKAGMKYFIITAKHHDGFAIYDSKVSDFNIIKQTPFKRDPMLELAVAAKKHGIKFGFYYSHAFDWEHPDAPGNDWEYNNPGGDKLIGGTNWYDAHPEWLPKAVKYVNEKAIPQIKELLTKYHPVTGDWEAIPTTNESYGYHKYGSSHKSVGHFIQLLASAASRGGNLLMNIGPKGDGTFDISDLNILNGIGKWMDKNGESIYGTVATPLPLQSWGVSTLKGNKLFLHVFSWPADGKLYVGGLLSSPKKAYMFNNPAKTFTIKKGSSEDFYITVPAKAQDSINTVLVLEWDGKLAAHSSRLLAPNSKLDRFLAFDAKQNGKGFGYGDGKTNRYYVEGWKSKEQSLSWEFNTLKTCDYKVRIKYLAPAENAGGSFELSFFKNFVEATKLESSNQYVVETDAKNTTVITKDLDVVRIDSGSHILMINPVSISGSELMKLLEI